MANDNEQRHLILVPCSLAKISCYRARFREKKERKKKQHSSWQSRHLSDETWHDGDRLQERALSGIVCYHPLVHFDYVSEPYGDVVASSITYTGFVGVLTGVREGLSLGLNFRGLRDGSGSFGGGCEGLWTFLVRYFLVFRPSIGSLLRGDLISGGPCEENFTSGS
jgi:hypothetical protein